jgi:hypothetical protein
MTGQACGTRELWPLFSLEKEATMTHPSTTKRGADPHVPKKPEKSRATDEHKLEQGLEESMAGSDPVSITQPAPADHKQR